MFRPLGKISLRTAAIKILIRKKEPMKAQEILLEVLKTGLVKTNGKTPINTLSALLNRLVKAGGIYEKFKISKTGQGLFVAKELA